MFGVLATLLATTTIAHGINWDGNRAASCQFIGNDLTNSLSSRQDCEERCASTVGCTHYTWTNYNNGTCWMKNNSVSRNSAVPKYDQDAVCGVIVGSEGRAISGVINAVADGIATGTAGGITVDSAGGGITVDTALGGITTNVSGGITPGVGSIAANVGEVISSVINWNGNNWAPSCQFIGNDLANALTSAKDCGGRCAATPGCTHYTWTNYNGGTCWMKKNLVSKVDAVPKQDQGAVCGIAVQGIGGAIAGNVGEVISSVINWNGNNWAPSCQFIGNDLANALTSAKDCGGRCAATPGCTHYTWTNYNGGTCWMKKNLVSKVDAVPKQDQGAVCGIAVQGIGGAIAGNVGEVISSVINWNGNNWATACQFIGNDLANALTSAKDCGGRCAATPGCTHYTWTNYNGGTCWMKKNLVSKVDAVPKQDQGAVCGIAVQGIGGAIAGNVGDVISSVINWNGNNWATACQFIGNDLANALTSAKDCGGRCAATPGCTHYTWTNYNGGTCWMKKNLVSKVDAVPKQDQGAVCGIAVQGIGGAIAGNVGEVISSVINWNGNNWATACQFIGNDLANALTSAKDCGGRCAATPGCTHYTWTNYNGGTCWMKKNLVSKVDAVPKQDQGAVCGIAVQGIGGAIAGNVGEVIQSVINWNGNNWATACQFIGNDLANAFTSAKDCGGRCAATPGCTHYTWTNYNGGTCWMKKNLVSKVDAVPKQDQGAVCGIAVQGIGGAIAGNVGEVISSLINWNGNNWAASCHFVGNDLANALTSAKDCGGRCAATPGCTHYTWTNYNGGTCWMKKNLVSKSDAVPRYEHGAVCGVVVKGVGVDIPVNVGEVIASVINWNGNNWAASCHFVGNDLTNALTSAKDCGGRCASTSLCTHYTWTNYNGGTCWMKKNLVSKSDAVPRYDHGAVCGVNIGSAGVGEVGTSGNNWNGNNWNGNNWNGNNWNGNNWNGNNWNGNNWVTSCDLTRDEDCARQCRSTPGCTQHTWTSNNGHRTCWLKTNSDIKPNVVTKHDQPFFFDYVGRPMPYYNQIILNLG